MSDINIGQFSEALNDKVDLDFNNMNPSSTSKNTIVGWGLPDYSNVTTLDINTPSPFDAWWWGDTNHYQHWDITLPDGTTTRLCGVSNGGLNSTCFQFFPKGTQYTSAYNNYKPKLVPIKGQ